MSLFSALTSFAPKSPKGDLGKFNQVFIVKPSIGLPDN
jgi:hypothetical protein